MNKILLSVNEGKIEIGTAACENARYLAQRLYGTLKEISCEPTSLQELRKIISHSNVSDYIKSRLVSQQKAEQPLEVLGMPVNTEKLKELIEVPNLDEVISLINEFDQETINAFRYLILLDGIFSLTPDYIQDITEKSTVYAVGDRQIDAARKLIALRDAMNDWLQFCGITANHSLDEIKGLKLGAHIGRYGLDVNYIQRM